MPKYQKFYASQADTTNPAQLQRVLNSIQQNTDDAFNELNKVSLLNNIIISDIYINGSATVNHKLGRTPVGYLVITRNANAQVWHSSFNDFTIVLASSTAVNITLLVF